jgi:hypothetical protein
MLDFSPSPSANHSNPDLLRGARSSVFCDDRREFSPKLGPSFSALGAATVLSHLLSLDLGKVASLGAADYAKPFEMPALLERLAGLLPPVDEPASPLGISEESGGTYPYYVRGAVPPPVNGSFWLGSSKGRRSEQKTIGCNRMIPAFNLR